MTLSNQTLGVKMNSMKIAALLLVLMSPLDLPFTMQLAAQDQPSVREPEEINQFHFLDSTGDIRLLEQETPKDSVIDGDSSPFRFVQGEPLAFVVKVASQDVDPLKTFQFVRLVVKGEHRLVEEGALEAKKRSLQPNAVPFEATEYGENSLKIKPVNDLGPGEYVLKLSGEKDGYCFGVEPVKTDLK